MDHNTPIEIERKFFVDDNSFMATAYSVSSIDQYYIEISDTRNTRVRNRDGTYTYTEKVSTGNVGEMYENEREISRKEFLELKKKATRFLHKLRYLVKGDGEIIWEVDVYDNGLIIAEVEIPSIDTPITIPDFIGNEITGDKRYSNISLSKEVLI